VEAVADLLAAAVAARAAVTDRRPTPLAEGAPRVVGAAPLRVAVPAAEEVAARRPPALAAEPVIEADQKEAVVTDLVAPGTVAVEAVAVEAATTEGTKGPIDPGGPPAPSRGDAEGVRE